MNVKEADRRRVDNIKKWMGLSFTENLDEGRDGVEKYGVHKVSEVVPQQQPLLIGEEGEHGLKNSIHVG